ncbi:hypothetical protein SDC9_210473 [bioreactor metagenome]|uniref:Uncharacterized protein n=1 Tax=bioreactor metagenome TaxID=1076179 RepID=A0A645JHZ0_9ZZZZ
MAQIPFDVCGVCYSACLYKEHCRLVIVEYSVQCLEEVSLCTGAEDRPPAYLNYFKAFFPYNVPVYSGFSEFVHEDSSPLTIRNCFKKILEQGGLSASEEA